MATQQEPALAGSTDPRRGLKRIEGAVVRFCGDSGDGMQVTGSQFTSTAALVGNDLSTFPGFPRGNPGSGRDALRGVRLPDQFLVAPRLHTRGRARRARGDEPRGAQDELEGSEARWALDREQQRVQQPEPEEGRLRRESPRGRFAQVVPDARGRRDEEHARLGRGFGPFDQGGRALQEFLDARAHVLDLRTPPRAHAPLDRRQVQEAPRHREGERTGTQGRSRLRRDRRDFIRPLRGSGRARREGQVLQHLRQYRDGVGLHRRDGTRRHRHRARVVSDHAGERRAPRAQPLQAVRRHDRSSGRRNRRGLRRDRCFVRGKPRRHFDERTWPRAQDGGHWPRRVRRTSARHLGRAARRPQHRHADENRASGLASGRLRQKQRSARVRPRRVDAG